MDERRAYSFLMLGQPGNGKTTVAAALLRWSAIMGFCPDPREAVQALRNVRQSKFGPVAAVEIGDEACRYVCLDVPGRELPEVIGAGLRSRNAVMVISARTYPARSQFELARQAGVEQLICVINDYSSYSDRAETEYAAMELCREYGFEVHTAAGSALEALSDQTPDCLAGQILKLMDTCFPDQPAEPETPQPQPVPESRILLLGASGAGKSETLASMVKLAALRNGEDSGRALEQLNARRVVAFDSATVSLAETRIREGDRSWYFCDTDSASLPALLESDLQYDGAILVVSSTRGITDEDEELLAAAKTAGIPEVSVFVNDFGDAIDSRLGDIELDAEDLLFDHGFHRAAILTGSAGRALQTRDTNPASRDYDGPAQLLNMLAKLFHT